MVRLNITMPEELAKELDQIRNKSQFIAQALREKFKREKKENLNKLLISAYKKASLEDEKVNKDWDRTTVKDWE